MQFSITISSWKCGFTNDFSLYVPLDLVSHFFSDVLCHLRLTIIDCISQVTFSVDTLFPLIHEKYNQEVRGQGEEKNEIFCPCSSHAPIPNICQDRVLSQLQHFTGDLSCVAPVVSGFCKIIHLFASSALAMVLSSCMLLLLSRKFYWFLNPSTNVNFNFIKISSAESCEWNLFSIKNIYYKSYNWTIL